MFGVFLVVATLAMAGLQDVITRANAEAERTEALLRGERAAAAVKASQDRLTAIAADWAKWTDTYEFVAGRHPRYVEDNLSADSMGNLDVDFMVFSDNRGKLVHMATALGPSGDPAIPSARFTDDISDVLSRFQEIMPVDPAPQLTVLAGRPAFVAACDITTNNSMEPPNGVLLVGTYVDDATVRMVRDFTGLDVDLDTPTQRAALGPAVVVYEADRIMVTNVLPAIDGSPALDVVTTQARTSNKQTSDTLWTVGWGLGGTTAVFGIALIVALNHTVLRRLRSLHAHVTGSSASAGTAFDCVEGRDEIADLARALDDAMERARRDEEQLRHQADHDYLTGLANRRLLERDAARAIAEAKRGGAMVSLLLVDLDDFKQINDTEGHACGDAVLRWFAGTALSVVREYSTVARVGGDEFAILLPNTDRDDAETVLGRLEAAVAGEQPCADCDNVRMSISCGVGVIGAHEEGGLDALLSAADAEMYRRKSERRNGTRG